VFLHGNRLFQALSRIGPPFRRAAERFLAFPREVCYVAFDAAQRWQRLTHGSQGCTAWYAPEWIAAVLKRKK
jgi:hypothetical protein